MINKKGALDLLAVVLILLSPWSVLQAAPQERQELSMQFTAAGHVLGFHAEGFYVTGGDHMLHVDFVGANGVAPEAQGAARREGRAPPLTRVRYAALWPGIDFEYGSVAGGIARSTWRLEPGADVEQIRLRYNVPVVLDEDGSLRLRYASGWLSESAPVAWQETDGGRKPVTVGFRLVSSVDDEPVIGFEVGPYDAARPLLIDPTLAWNTFLGSADSDFGVGVAADTGGNVYVVGHSYATWGSPVNAHAGNGVADVFVAKLDSEGALIWNTFLGAYDDDEYADAVTVDAGGNVYVSGYAGSTWGSPVNAHAGGGKPDAFVAKLNNNGTAAWHTFMGSTDYDYGYGVAVDGSGNVYVAGFSDSPWGSPVNPFTAGSSDAFAAKLDSNGNRVWHTFMGSADGDYVYDVAVDGSGNVYVAGHSRATWGSPVNAFAGYFDAFAAKLSNVGARVWNTFMGSSANDQSYGIAVDGVGNVYVAGHSRSTWGSPVNAHSGSDDAFAAKLNSSGMRMWNTFMGSSFEDYGDEVAADARGNAYVAGNSNASWGTPVTPYAGDYDAFAAMLNSSGNLVWNAFMGSADYDNEYGLAADGSGGSVYMTGYSWATWGSPVSAFSGEDEAFVAKFTQDLRDTTLFYWNTIQGAVID